VWLEEYAEYADAESGEVFDVDWNTEGERRTMVALNKLGATAIGGRRAFVTTLLARKTLSKGAAQFVADCLARDSFMLTHHQAADTAADCSAPTVASCYGLRRSEVCGLRWSDIDAQSTTLHIRQGRVTVIGGGSVVDEPKSQRSRRSLPMPTDLAEALYTLKATQKQEAFALGIPWSDDRLVAVREDGELVRPGWYSKEFHDCARGRGCAASNCTPYVIPRCRSCLTKASRCTSSPPGADMTRA